MSSETTFSRFAATAIAFRDRPFLNVLPETANVYGIEAGEISYGAMAQRVATWRDVLHAAGYGPGTRVGLLLQNRPVFLELWFALNALGASVVPAQRAGICHWPFRHGHRLRATRPP